MDTIKQDISLKNQNKTQKIASLLELSSSIQSLVKLLPVILAIILVSNITTLVLSRADIFNSSLGLLLVLGLVFIGATVFYLGYIYKKIRFLSNYLEIETNRLNSYFEIEEKYQLPDHFLWGRSLDLETYQKFKEEQPILKQFREKYKGFDMDHPIYKKLDFIYSPILNFYRKISDYYDAQNKVLKLLDRGPEDGKFLKKISEDELWNNRNQAYDYLI